jgi:hypothetical protein
MSFAATSCGIRVSRTPEQSALDRVQSQSIDLGRLDAIAMAALGAGTSVAPSAINGLKAQYFSGTNPDTSSNPLTTRFDGNINFKWRGMSFDPTNFPVQKSNFSVRWTGFIKLPENGSSMPQSYVFLATHADGFRMTVNDLPVLTSWVDHSTTAITAGSVSLTPGHSYPVKIDFYVANGPAEARLFWILPDGDFDLSKVAIVPASAFFRPNESSPPSNPPSNPPATSPLACNDPVAAGSGLVADVLSLDEKTCYGRRVDPLVNFWTGGGYAGQGYVDFNGAGMTSLPIFVVDGTKKTYRIEWNGLLQPRYTESYTLSSVSVEQMQLFIDDKLVIDSFQRHGPYGDGAAAMGHVNLDATKKHKIKIIMAQSGGAGVARILWQSAHQALEVIPATQFSHGAMGSGDSDPGTPPTTPPSPVALVVAPVSLSLKSGETHAFSVSGGNMPYTLSVKAQTYDGKSGAVTVSNGNYIYTAPSLVAGAANHIDLITVSDGASMLTITAITASDAVVPPPVVNSDSSLPPLAGIVPGVTDRDVKAVGYVTQIPCPTVKTKMCKASRYPAYSSHALMMWESYLLEGTVPTPSGLRKVYTGDYQINKQVLAFNIKEFFDENDNLHHIDLEYISRSTNTDEPWRFSLSLNGLTNLGPNDTVKKTAEALTGNAVVTTRLIYRDGHEVTKVTGKNQNAEIVPNVYYTPVWNGGWNRERLINNGSGSFGNSYAPNYITRVRIDVSQPSLNPFSSRSGRAQRGGIDLSRYRVFIDRGQGLVQSESAIGALEDLKEVVGDATQGSSINGGPIRVGTQIASNKASLTTGAEVYNGQYGVIVPRIDFQPVIANPSIDSGAHLWEMPGFQNNGTLEFFGTPGNPYIYNVGTIGVDCANVYCWGGPYYHWEVTGRDGIVFRAYPALKSYFNYLMSDRTSDPAPEVANWDRPSSFGTGVVLKYDGDPRTWSDLRELPASWR